MQQKTKIIILIALIGALFYALNSASPFIFPTQPSNINNPSSISKTEQQAHSILTHCSYFKDNYKKAYLKYLKKAKNTPVVYSAKLPDSFCGVYIPYTINRGSVIVIGVNSDGSIRCNLKDTLVHEFLHAAGLPVHDVLLQQDNEELFYQTDDVYKTTAKCLMENSNAW